MQKQFKPKVNPKGVAAEEALQEYEEEIRGKDIIHVRRNPVVAEPYKSTVFPEYLPELTKKKQIGHNTCIDATRAIVYEILTGKPAEVRKDSRTLVGEDALMGLESAEDLHRLMDDAGIVYEEKVKEGRSIQVIEEYLREGKLIKVDCSREDVLPTFNVSRRQDGGVGVVLTQPQLVRYPSKSDDKKLIPDEMSFDFTNPAEAFKFMATVSGTDKLTRRGGSDRDEDEFHRSINEKSVGETSRYTSAYQGTHVMFVAGVIEKQEGGETRKYVRLYDQNHENADLEPMYDIPAELWGYMKNIYTYSKKK